MTPLDFPALTEALIVVWVCALFIPLAEILIGKSRGRMPVRPLLFVASRYVSFGCMFTIFGIAQKANSLGLISYRLYWFAILMAALAVGCSGAATNFGPPAKARSEG